MGIERTIEERIAALPEPLRSYFEKRAPSAPGNEAFLSWRELDELISQADVMRPIVLAAQLGHAEIQLSFGRPTDTAQQPAEPAPIKDAEAPEIAAMPDPLRGLIGSEPTLVTSSLKDLLSDVSGERKALQEAFYRDLASALALREEPLQRSEIPSLVQTELDRLWFWRAVRSIEKALQKPLRAIGLRQG